MYKRQGNILTGTANTPSINNTINGYGNTGRNVERMSMMGTGNNICLLYTSSSEIGFAAVTLLGLVLTLVSALVLWKKDML